MKEKIKGKIFVGMIISLLAFGLATGASIFIGTNPLNSSEIMNLTQQGQFPSLPYSPSNVSTNSQQIVNTTTIPANNTQQVINPTKPNNSSNNHQNSNTTKPTNTTSSNG